MVHIIEEKLLSGPSPVLSADQAEKSSCSPPLSEPGTPTMTCVMRTPRCRNSPRQAAKLEKSKGSRQTDDLTDFDCICPTK